APGLRGSEDLLRNPRHAGPEEEAFDVRTAGLAEAVARGRRGAGDPARKDAGQADPAAARRPAEERTGRASVRTPGLHEPSRRRPSRRLMGRLIFAPIPSSFDYRDFTGPAPLMAHNRDLEWSRSCNRSPGLLSPWR